MKIEELKKGLIVSCQATAKEPMRDSSIIGRFALAAEMGGAVGVRINGISDILSVKQLVSVPVIGLIKHIYPGYWSYITPTLRDVESVCITGAEIVAVDATMLPKPEARTTRQLLTEIKKNFPDILLMADVSTLEEGLAAVDENGTILKKIRIENTGRSGPFIMDAYRHILNELKKDFPLQAIGVGTGGRIDEAAGTVLYAVGIYTDYIGLPVKQLLEQEFRLPTAVTNDCRAALAGEQWLGAAAGYQDVVGIILGTGLGGGVINRSQLLPGAFGGLGEIGHMLLHPGGRPCTCGQKGCAEQYISGTALWKSYNRRIGWEALNSGQDFFARVYDSDQTARHILEAFQRDLAYCAVTCANLFDPELILIGGGLADTASCWWDGFLAAYNDVGNLHTKNSRLALASKGNDAPLLGAARLAFDGHKT